MAHTFFENPFYVYLALGLAELVLFVIWRERRSPKIAWSLLAPPLLAVAVGLVAHFVVTDREQIQAAARDIAEAIKTRQPQRIPAYLDENFTAMISGLPVRKPEVTLVCNTSVEKWGITQVAFSKNEVEVTGSQARMHAVTVLTYGHGEKTMLIWDLVWVKRGGRWLILDVAEPRQGLET